MPGKIIIKTPEEIEAMRRSGKILAAAMEHLEKLIKPGVKSIDLDREAESFIRDHGAKPSFKGYRGYPASICCSFNQQVVHGIPGGRKLKEGDVVGIDCGVYFGGYHSDMARTFHVGDKPSGEVRKLMETTRRCLEEGIGKAVAGNRLGDISNAVQKHAEGNGYSVVRALVGHGIGKAMHEEPQVPNYGPANSGPELQEYMTLAIEPMVNQGSHEVRTLEDGWTVVTVDGKLSCHFEHTIAIMPDGPKILTLP